MLREKFDKQCKEIGISGVADDLSAELTALTAEIPGILKHACALIQTTPLREGVEYDACLPLTNDPLRPCLRLANILIYDVCRYYSAFLDFTLATEAKEARGAPLKLLSHVIEHGDTSVYKYRTGKDLPSGDGAEDSAIGVASADGGIDFGDEGSGIDFGDGGGGGIDFGDDGGIDFGDGGGGGIDFGDGNNGAGIDFGESGADGGIDFGDDNGIDFGDGTTDGGGIDFGDDGAATITTEPVTSVRKTDRSRILTDTVTRNELVDHLLELEHFLIQRSDELGGRCAAIFVPAFSASNQAFSVFTPDEQRPFSYAHRHFNAIYGRP